MKTFDLFGEVPEKKAPRSSIPTPTVNGNHNRKGISPKASDGLATYAKMFPTPTKADGERSSLTYCRGNPTLRGAVLSNPSTSSSADSPAKISAWQERARASTEAGAVFGGNSTALLVNFAPDTSSWKTSLPSLFGDYLPYSERFPKSGMMRNGKLYQRPRLAPRTLESDSSLWPTPSGADAWAGNLKSSNERHRTTLAQNVKMWPTPTNSMMTVGDVEQARYAGNDPRRPDYETANKIWPTAVKERELGTTPTSRDWKSSNASPETMARNARPLNEAVTGGKTGQLNSEFVEWLMGFPKGYTDLTSGPKSGSACPEPSEDSPTASTD